MDPECIQIEHLVNSLHYCSWLSVVHSTLHLQGVEHSDIARFQEKVFLRIRKRMVNCPPEQRFVVHFSSEEVNSYIAFARVYSDYRKYLQSVYEVPNNYTLYPTWGHSLSRRLRCRDS